MKIERLIIRLEAMLNTAKKIQAEEIERFPETSTQYSAGRVSGLELALQAVKEEMEVM